MDINFKFPTEIIGGQGSIKNFEGVASMGRRALIVCGSAGARLSGALADVVKLLDSNNIDYSIYDKVSPNPAIDECEGARKFAEGAEFIIAIGGGSVMDAAKAIAVLCANPDLPAERLYDSSLCAIPIVCVGITAGTGSEANCSSVITNRLGQKKGFSNPAVFPRYSFCDPRYTCSLDLRQTVSTALDAFCHAVESLFSTKATLFSESYSERAIQLIFPALRKIADGGFIPEDMELRESLLYGSVLAGRAICFAGTGYPHPAGYPFTEHCGLPHGAACALFIEDFLKRTGSSRPEFYNWLCYTAGGENELYRVLRILTRNSFKISPEFADGVFERIKASNNLKRSLCPQTEDEIQSIIAPYVDEAQAELVTGSWDFGV